MDGEVMSDNSFFKPTLLYKEFMILDLIEKDANITQREISKTIGVAVSMVNQYLDSYEKSGLIKKKKHSTKTVEYFVTKKGKERIKVLNIGYLNSAQQLYDSAKENIEVFMNQIRLKGFRNILLYGAGEVCEIFLNTINNKHQKKLNILAVVDDDIEKIGQKIVNTSIISINDIFKYDHDGILISSYRNKDNILKKLLSENYDFNKVIHFFN
jgi:DNA-binding MarR family transcriptional regulator